MYTRVVQNIVLDSYYSILRQILSILPKFELVWNRTETAQVEACMRITLGNPCNSLNRS